MRVKQIFETTVTCMHVQSVRIKVGIDVHANFTGHSIRNFIHTCTSGIVWGKGVGKGGHMPLAPPLGDGEMR